MSFAKSVPLFIFVLGLCCLVGYGQGQKVIKTDLATTLNGDNSNPNGGRTGDISPNPPLSQYKLGSADLIHVNVWKSTELSQNATVDPDGFVSLPLLGDVRAAGLTANELALDIGSKLKIYVVNAQVTVSIVEIRSRRVFVTGQIGKPGAYPLVAPVTILQIIAEAGGLNTYANRKKIVVLRGPKENFKKIKFNYSSAVQGDVTQDIALQPGDTVIIP